MDYTVTFELSITASSPEEAARFALDDLRDRGISPWNAIVTSCEETKDVTVDAH